MKITAVRIAFLFLFGLVVWAGANLYIIEGERRALTEDATELAKIKYGIFNVDAWKRIAARIIAAKIEEFDLSPSERREMRAKINAFLTDVIGELKERFEEENRKGVLGFLRREGASFFGIFDKMERDIPVFTDQIISFLDDPANRDELRSFLTEKTEAYADQTFAETDYTLYNEVLQRTGAESGAAALERLRAEIIRAEQEKRPFLTLIYTVIALCFAFLVFSRRIDKWALSFMAGASLVVLFLGVMMPMIEIDARITRLSFQLSGEPVVFTDQVLYFKSKSILEVVGLMIGQGKADLLAVGVLVFAFSVLFPAGKTAASLVFLHFRKMRSDRFLRFMVFKTGKWSMADVMVVAIFMSYIGFSGILSEQLGQLEGIAKNADVLTTDHSRLQTGFFMFFGFVVLSLGTAQRLSVLRLADAQAVEP